MPPKFSLQTVLDVRHSRVESLEIDLGRMQQERLQKENYLHTLYMAQDELYVKLHARMTGELDLIEMNMLRANINQLSQRIEKNQSGHRRTGTGNCIETAGTDRRQEGRGITQDPQEQGNRTVRGPNRMNKKSASWMMSTFRRVFASAEMRCSYDRKCLQLQNAVDSV